MALSDFSLGASDPSNPNSIVLTPTQQQLKLAAALQQMKSGADSSPIQSPWQGAARLADGLMGGLAIGQAEKAQADGAKGAGALAADALMKQFALGGGGAAATPAGTPSVSVGPIADGGASPSNLSAALLGSASGYLGKNENKDGPAIASYLAEGHHSLDPAVSPWCAAFVGSALDHAGLPSIAAAQGGNVATSYLNYGQPVTNGAPQQGDVIVEARGHAPGETGGHVGIATGKVDSQGRVQMLSGNYGDSVGLSWEDPKSINIRRAAPSYPGASPAGGAQSPAMAYASPSVPVGALGGGAPAQVASLDPNFVPSAGGVGTGAVPLPPPRPADLGGSPASAPVQVAANGGGVPASPAIAVPGYSGQFTRAQANDGEGVPSQADWDAAQAGAARGGQQVAGGPSGAPQPQAAPSPSAAPQNQAALAAWVKVLQNPYSTPAMQQIAASMIQAASKQDSYSAPYKDPVSGAVVQRAATGELKIISAADKENDAWQATPDGMMYNKRTGEIKAGTGGSKPFVMGEDQFGGKIYGTMVNGVPTPLKTQPANGVAPSAAVSGLHGEDFIKTLDPQLQPQVRAIIEGRAPYPSGMFQKTPLGQKLEAYVTQADPTFESGNAGARTALRKEFTAGGANTPSGQIVAGNTALQHLAEVSDAAEAMHNGSYPMVNAASNWLGSQTGGALPLKAYNTAVGRFTEEATKFYRGTGGGEADIQRVMKNLDPNQSPEQLRIGLATESKLIHDKISELQDKWRKGMGPMVPEFPIVGEAAQGAYDKVQGRAPVIPGMNGASAQGAMEGGATHIWTPNGGLQKVQP
jgi:uncharacterized protein (TIGR02594 family)